MLSTQHFNFCVHKGPDMIEGSHEPSKVMVNLEQSCIANIVIPRNFSLRKTSATNKQVGNRNVLSLALSL